MNLRKTINSITLIIIGSTAEGYAKDRCPVDTGRLMGEMLEKAKNVIPEQFS